MGKESLFDRIRRWIGHLAWVIFLWSIRMTEEQYMDAQDKEVMRRHLQKLYLKELKKIRIRISRGEK